MFWLSLMTILLLSGAFVAISINNNNMLSNTVDQAGKIQQATVSEITRVVMDRVVTDKLGDTNRTIARFADMMFLSAKERVTYLADRLKMIVDSPEGYEPQPYTKPDPANDGNWTPKVIFAPGTNEQDPVLNVKIGRTSNLADTMISLCKAFGMSDMYIGLPEGAFFTVSNQSSYWFVDGKPREYDPRKRIWYRQACEAHQLIFTDGEWDANTGEYCIECAMPVYDKRGGLEAVVGMDLYLDEIEQVINNTLSEGEYNLLVNENGKAVLPMQAEEFPMTSADRERTLLESENETLAQITNEALKGNSTDVTLGQLENENYYLIATPIPTTGWVLISAFSQEIAMQPESLLQEYLADVQTGVVMNYHEKTANTQRTAILLLAGVTILILGGAILLGRRIVKPLNMITRRVSGLGEDNLEFKMADEYRTGDEVEKLAESFANLSHKTLDYMEKTVKATAEKERIGTELALGNQIQATMLPHTFPAFPDRNEFDIYASMDPAKEVGGDFYDYFLIDDDHLGLVMADVSGKGVPAALYMMACKIMISDNAMTGKSPAQMLNDANARLCANGQEDMFVTVWIGILELSTGKLTAANGGHEYPVLMKDGRFELYKDVHGLFVGGIPGLTYENYEIQMKPGDRLFMYTDGIPEANNKERKLFGTERMVSTLNTDPTAELKTVLKNVREAVDQFANGAEQFDDLTMLCIEYKGKKEEDK